jgi:diguanylate cyclase (GGDEF)-like protein
MPDSNPRAIPLPPDTERDTRLLYLFRPAALPWVLGAMLWAVVFMVLPLPVAAKLALGVVLPAGALGALAADAPERLMRLRRYWRDGPERYAGQATPGNVRALYPNDGTLGVALEVLPPPWTGRGGADLDGERGAWVRAARRLKSGRANAAVTVEMVADSPPRPGWEVPEDLPLAPGYERFAELRQRHFEALVREGRAMRPRTLLRVAVGNGATGGVAPELHLDRVTNGIAGELQAVGVMALPLDLDLLREMATGTEEGREDVGGASEAEGTNGTGEVERSPQAVSGPLGTPSDNPVPVADAAPVQAAAGTMPSVPRPVIRLPKLPAFSVAMPSLHRHRLPVRASDAGCVLATTEATSEGGSPVWPDLDALAADAGRTWDVGLAVLGALPRVGTSSALLGWAAQRRDPSCVVLVDANLERAGGLWLACGKGLPPDGPGWLEPGDPACRAVAPCGAAVIGQGAGEDGPCDPPFAAGRLIAAVRGSLRRAAGDETVIALDLGSPSPLTDRLRAHPLVELAAREAAAVAVVTRQDAAAMYAAYRMLNTLRARGATEVRVWVAAYDTADPLTLAEMRATLGVPVEEAPPPPGRRWDGTGAGVPAVDALTGALTRASGEAMLAARVTAAHSRREGPLSVLFLDVDDLKRANDGEGHAAGDRLLRETAEAVRGCLRRGDVLIRWGGDEFVALLPGAGEAAAAGAVARMRAAGVGCSIGAATLADGEDAAGVIARADAAMYADKRRRKAGRA